MENNDNDLKKISIDDLIIKKSLGVGRFGHVYLVSSKFNNNKNYALKVINKFYVNKFQKTHYIIIEKILLSYFNFNKIVKLYSTFQDKNNLYFLWEYISGGTLSYYISLKNILEINEIKFLTYEILKILSYLRKIGVIHRDLKPENLLLTKNMNIKMIDFGTSKVIKNENNIDLVKNLNKNKLFYSDSSENLDFSEKENNEFWNRNSIAGSPFYISPEVMDNKSIHFCSDYWSLGVLVYKMTHGNFPFNEGLVSYIEGKSKINFRKDLDNDCKDFIKKLLVINPLKRFGFQDENNDLSFNALLNHPFLNNFKFNYLNINDNKVIKEIKSPLVYKSDIKIIVNNFDLNLKNSNIKSLVVEKLDSILLYEGNIKIVKLKIFKFQRFTQIFSNGDILIFSKKRKTLRKHIKITKTTKIIEIGQKIKIITKIENIIIIPNKTDNFSLFNILIKTKKKLKKKSSVNF